MKLFCLSDLYLCSEAAAAAIDRQYLLPFLVQIAVPVAEVLLVTGDIVSTALVRLLSGMLRTFIPSDLAVVATLGNHEFRGRIFEDIPAKLEKQTLAAPDIFYLDLIGEAVPGFMGVNVGSDYGDQKTFTLEL